MSVIIGRDGTRYECNLAKLQEVDEWCAEKNKKLDMTKPEIRLKASSRQDWLEAQAPKKTAKPTKKASK